MRILVAVALFFGGLGLAASTNLAPAAYASEGRYVDVFELQPGDRILVGPGRVETVRKCPTKDAWGGVEIQTNKSHITTGLPCAVKVLP